MRWKWLCVFILLGGAAVTALAFWLSLPPPHHINGTSLSRIQPAMSQSEVETMLGGPAGDYSGGRMVVGVLDISVPVGGSFKEWVAEEFAIGVCFDENGKVAYATPLHVVPTGASFFERLRRRLGL
jgi:hypothetical protein